MHVSASDIASLTPQARREVEATLRELERRKIEERLRYWKPVKSTDPNPHGVQCNDQEGFLMDPSVERWLLGANRAMKTETGVVDCVWFAQGIHPIRSAYRKPPVMIRYCAPSYEDSIKGVILKKMKGLIPRSWLLGNSFDKAWSNTTKTLTFKNGSKVSFRSFEQDVDKFAGDDLDAVYADEHGSAAHYRENKMRLIDRNGFFVATMTPDAGSITWEKKHIFNRTDAGLRWWQFSIYGNPHLSVDGIKEIEMTITDERIRDVKLFGKFVALAGLIYPQFNQQIHMIPSKEIPADWYKIFCIDPHLKKASAMTWAAITPDNEIIFYRCAKKFLTPKELKKFIRVQSMGERIDLFMGDEAMGGDGLNIFGEESVLRQLASGDDAIPVIPTSQSSDKSFEAGVTRVRELLSADPISLRPSLYLMQDCVGIADEFEEYQFMPETKQDELTFRERVRTVDDDYMSCVRYTAMSAAMNTKKEKSPHIVLPGRRREVEAA